MMQLAGQNQFDDAAAALAALRLAGDVFFAIRIFFIPADTFLGLALMTRFGTTLANYLEVSPSKIHTFAFCLLVTAAVLLITGWFSIPF